MNCPARLRAVKSLSMTSSRMNNNIIDYKCANRFFEFLPSLLGGGSVMEKDRREKTGSSMFNLWTSSSAEVTIIIFIFALSVGLEFKSRGDDFECFSTSSPNPIYLHNIYACILARLFMYLCCLERKRWFMRRSVLFPDR